MSDELADMKSRLIIADRNAVALAEYILRIDRFYLDAIQSHRISRAGCPDKMTKDKNALEIRNLQTRHDLHLGDGGIVAVARVVVEAYLERKE